MTRSGISIGITCTLVCAFLAAGCSKDEPCYPNSLGKQYRVVVVEIWDEMSQFPGGQHSFLPCPRDLDLFPGSSFVVQVDSFNDDGMGCNCGAGKTIEGPTGWTWNQSVIPGGCPGSFFQGGTLASDGTCKAQVRIDIDASRIPTGSSVPGRRPVASAVRQFSTTTGEEPTPCPIERTPCGDNFVVEIEQL